MFWIVVALVVSLAGGEATPVAMHSNFTFDTKEACETAMNSEADAGSLVKLKADLAAQGVTVLELKGVCEPANAKDA